MRVRRLTFALLTAVTLLFPCRAEGLECGEVPPGPLSSLTLTREPPTLEWAALPMAETYDVVMGEMEMLRATGGDFGTATLACVANSTAATSTSLTVGPGFGQVYWFLVRANNCAGAGTYDSGGPGQAESRDAELESSTHSCHLGGSCGDGTCGGSEACSTCPADCGSCACTVDAECQPASCCNPVSCIPIWEPQSCGSPNCGDGCWICLSGCTCQAGECVAMF